MLSCHLINYHESQTQMVFNASRAQVVLGDGFQNIMTSVSYSFPHGLIETKVIIKWLYRLYCIVSHKIKCTNGKLKYISVNKMGTTLTEEYGTTSPLLLAS